MAEVVVKVEIKNIEELKKLVSIAEKQLDQLNDTLLKISETKIQVSLQ